MIGSVIRRHTKIRRGQVLIVFLMFYYINGVLSENSANLTCLVDYHGHIKFKMFIPERYQMMGVEDAYIYYQMSFSSKERMWIKEKDCRLTNGKKTVICTMFELHKQLSTFIFKLSIISKSGVENITNLHFADKPNYKIHPWTTMSKVTRCADSVGVKYLALYAEYTNVTVEWIRYPLDIMYSYGKPRISILGDNINYTNTVATQSSCVKDLCKYMHQSLDPCSRYRICIQWNSLRDPKREKCKSINTYCTVDNDQTIIWQDTLLIIFGVIILITFLTMGIALFNKYKVAGGVIGEDAVTPRGQSTNEYLLNHHRDSQYRDVNLHLYQYPDLIKVIETDLLWTTVSNNPSPNMSSETMLSEC